VFRHEREHDGRVAALARQHPGLNHLADRLFVFGLATPLRAHRQRREGKVSMSANHPAAITRGRRVAVFSTTMLHCLPDDARGHAGGWSSEGRCSSWMSWGRWKRCCLRIYVIIGISMFTK